MSPLSPISKQDDGNALQILRVFLLNNVESALVGDKKELMVCFCLREFREIGFK